MQEIMQIGSYAKGLLLMLSLIVAIGPQNALVLRQAIRREWAMQVALICFFGDVIMVIVGAWGMGTVMSKLPLVSIGMSICAALYMLIYAFCSVKNALNGVNVLRPSKANTVIWTAFAVTFLNPHAIMDTILIVGTVSNRMPSASHKLSFILGAISASGIWFIAISRLGGILAAPLNKPELWKVIDLTVAAVMCLIAMTLLAHTFAELAS